MNMKKRIFAFFMAISLLLSAVACGENGKTKETSAPETDAVETNAPETNAPETNAPETDSAETAGTDSVETAVFDYMANDLSQYITIGDYQGLEVERVSPVLTDKEYDDYLAAMLQQMASTEQITDRAVQAGETIVGDFSGYLNGVQFENGTAQDQEIVAADGNGMIDGFGAAFVGRMPGEEFSFNVTFPEIYGNLELAGKEVTFICTVDYIKGELVTPELTDTFVREKFGYQTVADFEAGLYEVLVDQKAQSANNQMLEALWSQIYPKAEIFGYPEGEVERYRQTLLTEVNTSLQMYSMTMDEYLEASGMTQDDFEAMLLESAESYVKNNLVIYQLAKNENVTVTDAEYQTRLSEVASMYGVTVETFLMYYDEATIKESLVLALYQEKAVAEILKVSVIVEPSDETDAMETEAAAE